MTTSDSESLRRLLEKMHTGRIQIPEFQRALDLRQDWTISLLASVSLNYPIGAVTLLATGGHELPFTSRPVPGAPPTSTAPELLLIDGQYRLTALYQAFRQGSEHSYYIDLDAAGDRDRAIVAISDGAPVGPGLFPLHRAFGPGGAGHEILRGFREYVVPIILLGAETARWTVRVHGGPHGPDLSERFFGRPA